MKHLLKCLFFLSPIFLSAQSTEGLIVFSETVQLKIDIPDGPQAEELRKMLPGSQTFKSALYFNENESLYRDAEGETNEQESNHEQDGLEMRIVMQRPDNRLYINLDEAQTIESKEFFGRQFLIKETYNEKKWKLAPEQKQILGYTCQKAILQDTSKNVVAWFTTQIQAPFGPSLYTGLPGMVLELDANNGERVIQALKVDLKKLEKDQLEKPTKGKSVTRKEFDAIVEEKTKEMNMESGGGGNVRMIIRN